MQYHTSTQKEYWTFKCQNELDMCRFEANDSAIKRIKETIEKDREIQRVNSVEVEQYSTALRTYDDNHICEFDKLKPKVEFLTPTEEKVFYEFYELKLRDICQLYRKQDKVAPPLKIVGTAIAFFKRFFLHNSCMDYPLQDIMYTCIFLAFKTEERTKDLDTFLQIAHFNGTREKYFKVILDLEIIVVEQLHFHLQILHPMGSIDGILADLSVYVFIYI
jgi:cyclin ccl1